MLQVFGESGQDPFGLRMGSGRTQDQTWAKVWTALLETVTDV